MKLNTVYTTNGNDVIVNVGGIYYHYDEKKVTMNVYTQQEEELHRLNTVINIPLSQLKVSDDVQDSELEALLNNPLIDSYKFTVGRTTFYIKNFYMKENPNTTLYIKYRNSYIYVSIGKYGVIEFGESDRLKNVQPIKAPVYLKTRSGFAPTECFSTT